MASDIPYIYRAPTTFHFEGTEHQPIESGLLNLHIGQGVIWHDGRRLRVVDSWYSFDHHGYFNDGLHIFLEEVTDDEDDLPKRMAPDYFKD